MLPRSWLEWKELPLAIRRDWKKWNEQAVKDLQKTLQEAEEPFNANSNEQKLTLFYHFFGKPDNVKDFGPDTRQKALFEMATPPWSNARGIPAYKARKQDGGYGPSTDRACLERIQSRALQADNKDAAWWAQPFVSGCLATSDLTKTLGFLNCKLENGRFKSAFSATAKTGRLRSRKNHQGFGWNAQNITPPLRAILTADRGEKIVAIDYEQIESRCVGAICYSLFGATAYLNATESGDLHSLACSLVWDELDWPADFTLKWLTEHGPFPKDMIRAAKKIANTELYREKTRRDASKTLGHAKSYLSSAREIAKRAHIPLALVQHYYDAMDEAFPEILDWHQWTIEQVQTKQELTTIVFGRVRQFFGRPSDDAVIREAVAHCPQSMGADYTNQALLRLHKTILRGELDARLFLQKHDELGLFFSDPGVVPQIQSIMEEHYTLTAPDGTERDWYVPSEALVGWNLGYKNPENPDGLTKYPDNRSRVRDPFDLMDLVF